MLRLSPEEAARLGIPGAGTAQELQSVAIPAPKYRNRRVRAYGRLWPSNAELRRYGQLLQLGAAGLLQNLELQPRFPLWSAEQRVAVYVGDFAYDDLPNGLCLAPQRVVEDVKGFATPVYRLKARLFQAQYPQIVFREVR